MASLLDETNGTGPLGIGNSDNNSPRKKSIDAGITHSSINTVKSDVSSIFASGSSDGDNEMSSSSDAVVMRVHTAAYQSKTSTSRFSKIPVPGAGGASKKDGLRRVNSMGARGSSRSAPSSGHSTPVPPEPRPEQTKVAYRNNGGRLSVGNNEDANKHRLSLNEQTFRSLPSSANSSPSNKRRNGSTSANTLTVTTGVAKAQQQSSTNRKTSNSHPALTKTSSASTPEEIRKAKEREKSRDVTTRLTKPPGNKQKTGTSKGIPVPSSSRSHSQCSSRSESPIEQNTYTSGTRRSTMPSKLAAPKQVTKETNALAKLASRITQWAQRTQNEPEPKVPTKSQKTKKSSAKSYRDIPARRTPSPYDRTVTAPVRKSSFKLKGSRGSVGSIGSVSPIDSQLMPTGDVIVGNHSDREGESLFSDVETPLMPTSPLTETAAVAGGIDSSSLESSAFMESSGSSYGSNTATPITVVKRTPRDVYRHSPYLARVAGASSSKTAGELDQLIGELNLEEIEGAVSIEADEYRRMAQEVKALKTVLLKLKRELQADHQGISPVSSAAKGKAMKARRASPTPPDLTVKVEQITQEKVQLGNKLEKTKKELLTRDSKIEQLEKQLKNHQDENKQLKDKLSSLEKHREYLLDKVERLHADKHKLEDRLSVVENNQDFVDTLSDLEISDDDVMDQLKHFHAESYDVSDGCVEENSDPESQAAMTGSLQ